MSIIRENIVIEKCKDIITKYNNGGLSLDDVLTEVDADGLNFHVSIIWLKTISLGQIHGTL